MLKKILNYNNHKIIYRVRGEGSVLLFIHGFGETSAIWNLINKSFSGYKVIFPDLPGSGESPASFMGMNAYARLMYTLIESEGVTNDEKITVIGHSMGGYIALEMCRIKPEKINGLVLFHSSIFADDQEKIITRKKAIEFIKKNGAHAFLKNSIPDLFSEISKVKERSKIEDLIESAKNFTPEVLVHYYEMMIERRDQSDFITAAVFPVLVIAGEEDKAVPLKISLKQSHVPSICQLLILQNVAHMGMIESPSECINAINSFLLRFNI